MPETIRTDNGALFASLAVPELSRLLDLWLKRGFEPERSEAAHRERNGRHDRTHRTIKQKLEHF